MAFALFSKEEKVQPVHKQLAEAGFTPRVSPQSWLHTLWFVSRRGGGVWLEVPAEQFERAEDFLLNLDAKGTLLQEAIRCPECHSLRVGYPQFARHSLLTNLALGVAAELGLVEKEYYCERCHFTWPREGSRPRRNRPHMGPYYFIEGIEQTTRRTPPPEQQRAAA